MKAVILAAGKSTRTYPFTITRPKALLPILDKTLIEKSIETLTGKVDEIIIIVGHMKEQIIKHLGNSINGIKLVYLEQKEQLGTGHALMQARNHIQGKFMLLNGDDLYSPKDIANCLNHELCVLGKEVTDPEKWGIFVIEKGELKAIVEKPSDLVTGIGNTGFYVLDEKIFSYLEKTAASERGEIELTSAITAMCKSHSFGIELVKDYWLPVSYPWQLLEANVFFLNRIEKSRIQGTVEEHVVTKGILVLGEGSVVKSGTYIEGPVWIGKGCQVGPAAYLRKNTIILDKVRTRAEVIESVIMSGTTAKHTSYIGYSVIGENCNIAAGTVTADFRHDNKNNITIVQGKRVDSGRRKLGAFVGDNVRTGINTSIYPGRKIWPGMTTKPGEIVSKDLM